MQKKYASLVEAARIPVSRGAAALVIGLLLFATPRALSPDCETLLKMAGFVLAGAGAIGRLWCSIYIGGRKTHELVMDGPYGLCRNPLYLFSLIGALGVALSAHSLTIFLVVGIFFALYYPGVIRSEESKLRPLYGKAFDDYCATTPAFFPRRFSNLSETPRTVDVRLFRKDMAEVIWFILAVALMGGLDILRAHSVLPSFFTMY
ncbi:MAG: isoprenylcysteine carboxylmethyltransferase family protein [bacterium]|nr:isoprenylcysteine carboxylmethyltransferase family protein [bacterium]